MTIDTNFQRTFKINDHTLMGVSGLGTDVQTLYVFLNFLILFSNSLMKFKLNLYKLKEGREMKADTFSKLVATTLYEHR